MRSLVLSTGGSGAAASWAADEPQQTAISYRNVQPDPHGRCASVVHVPGAHALHLHCEIGRAKHQAALT